MADKTLKNHLEILRVRENVIFCCVFFGRQYGQCHIENMKIRAIMQTTDDRNVTSIAVFNVSQIRLYT